MLTEQCRSMSMSFGFKEMLVYSVANIRRLHSIKLLYITKNVLTATESKLTYLQNLTSAFLHQQTAPLLQSGTDLFDMHHFICRINFLSCFANIIKLSNNVRTFVTFLRTTRHGGLKFWVTDRGWLVFSGS